MKKLIPLESDKQLKTYVKEVQNSSDAISMFLKFFNDYKIKREISHLEEDMLLFQYGNYDYQDGNGKEFSLDFTRQFEIPNEEEYYQLSLTLFYDYKQLGEIKSFSSWSIESEDLLAWEKLIKNSEGYLKSKELRPKRIEIELEET